MSVPSASLRDIWQEATARLEAVGVPDARFDAEVLLRYASARGRADFYAHLAEALPPAAQRRFQAALARREAREPLAYIVGSREFYRLEIAVNPAVLIPRPESELLVEAALDHLRRQRVRNARVVDVGTGSGALGIAIAKNRRDARLIGIDVSRDALRVARGNAARLVPRRPMDWLQADLLTALSGPLDCIVANLPYVPEARRPTLQPEVARHEPAQALFTRDPRGLDVILRFVTQLPSRLAPGGIAIVELDPEQAAEVATAAQQVVRLAEVDVLHDLAGDARAVKIVAG